MENRIIHERHSIEHILKELFDAFDEITTKNWLYPSVSLNLEVLKRFLERQLVENEFIF
jgi:hypothetical protein